MAIVSENKKHLICLSSLEVKEMYAAVRAAELSGRPVSMLRFMTIKHRDVNGVMPQISVQMLVGPELRVFEDPIEQLDRDHGEDVD